MKHRWPFLLTSLVVLLAARPSQASCIPQTVRERFNQADIVLQGTVFSVMEDEAGGTEALIEPTVVYKGTADDTVVIVDPDGPTVTSIDVTFAESETPYLLFLKRRDDESFATNTCLGSRQLDTGLTAEEREVLGQGTVPPAIIDDLAPPDLGPEPAAGTDAESVADRATAAPPIEQLADWLLRYPWWIVLGALWTLAWKGMALWYAARKNQAVWFVVFLLVPTLGIVEIIFLALSGRPNPPAWVSPPSSAV